MSIRYEPVERTEVALLEVVRDKYFPELWEARILLLFDTKKVLKGGTLTLARIRRSGDLIRYLTKDDAVIANGYDYVIFLDKMVWTIAAEEDRLRIMRHELRHAVLDLESESDPWKLRGHDFEDFRDEVELNVDNPRWSLRLAEIAVMAYEQNKVTARENSKEKKTSKSKLPDSAGSTPRKRRLDI